MYGNLKRGEDTEQMGVIDWANWNTGRFPELKLLFHIPNGGKRDVKEAARFKAMGVKAGVPDLCLPVPMNGFAGLYIEMKYGKNKPTDHQKEWIKALKEQGYKVTVCYSGAEATQELERYLQGVRTILSNPASKPCRPQKRIAIYCARRDVLPIKAALAAEGARGGCIFGDDFLPKDCDDSDGSEDCAACILKNVDIYAYD